MIQKSKLPTEEEAEEALTPEIVPPNQLQVIVKESGLEQSLAQEFTINFEEHFKMASEWAKKAKKMIVTNENQVVEMEQARTARLFLRKKRIEIENFRVEKKDYYLKAGRAIDRVASFLKDTIIPIEEHLERQEKFIEFKKKAEEEAVRVLVLKKMEEDRLKAEQDALEEQARIRAENEKLRKEAEAKEKALQLERAKVEAEKAEAQRKADEERLKAQKEADEKERINQEKLRKVREENEKAMQVEREKTARIEDELRAKKEAEEKAKADEARRIEKLRSAGDNEKLATFKLALQSLDIPELTTAQGKKMLAHAHGYLTQAILSIDVPETTAPTNQEEY